MATMKTNSFGWNIDDPDQKHGYAYCERLKKKKQLSEYIRKLVLDDIKKRTPAPQQGVKSTIGKESGSSINSRTM